jgi:hypothetical protein
MISGLNSENVTNKVIIGDFNEVRKLPRWHGRWITDADWCELLRRSSTLVGSLTKSQLNQAIARSSQTKFGFEGWESNPIGLLRRHHNVRDNNTWCYFASVPGSIVTYPVDGTPWFSEVEAIHWPTRTSRSFEEIQQVVVSAAAAVVSAAAVVPAAVTDAADSAKRPRPGSSLQSVSRRLLDETAWDSATARKVFAPRDDDASESVLEVIQKRQTLLFAAHFNASGYKNLVDGHDPNDLMSSHDMYVIRLKALYLHTALNFASKEWMPGSVTWGECCEKAIEHFAFSGVGYCSRARTIMDWHMFLRMNNTLPHPYRFAGKEKVMNPPFFDQYPTSKESFIRYGRENLSTMSTDMMLEYAHSVLVPEAMALIEFEGVKEEFLRSAQLTTLSPPTIWRWLKICGFNFMSRRKHYVDGHEKPEVRKYRMAFVDRYLKYERRCYRGIQIPLEEANLIWESGELIHGSGYRWSGIR